MVLTGTSIKKQGDGKLLFLDRESLDTVSEIAVADTVRSHKTKLRLMSHDMICNVVNFPIL